MTIAISPLRNTGQEPSSTQPQPKVFIFGLTTTKVEKITCIFFATLTALGAISLTFIGSISLTSFFFLPLLVTSACCLWRFLTLKDYDDPKQLAIFQKNAASDSLLETFKQHGAYNMVRYGIPDKQLSKEDFSKMSLMEAIALHEALHKAFCSLGKAAKLDFPSIKSEPVTYFCDKFTDLINLKNVCEIFAKEPHLDIEKIKAYNLLPKANLSSLKEAKKSYDKACKKLQKASDKPSALVAFSESIAAINTAYQNSVSEQNIETPIDT